MKRIDELNLIEIDGVSCCQGHVYPFGASLSGNGGINFSINSIDATGCQLQLYHQGEEEAFANIPLPDQFRVGSNYSILVFGQNPEELEYTWRFSGEMNPEKGLRFDQDLTLLDPYARLVFFRKFPLQS